MTPTKSQVLSTRCRTAAAACLKLVGSYDDRDIRRAVTTLTGIDDPAELLTATQANLTPEPARIAAAANLLLTEPGDTSGILAFLAADYRMPIDRQMFPEPVRHDRERVRQLALAL